MAPLSPHVWAGKFFYSAESRGKVFFDFPRMRSHFEAPSPLGHKSPLSSHSEGAFSRGAARRPRASAIGTGRVFFPRPGGVNQST